MIWPSEKDIKRNIRSFNALRNQSHSESEFIKSLSESMAYQTALNLAHIKIISEQSKYIRELEAKLKRAGL